MSDRVEVYFDQHGLVRKYRAVLIKNGRWLEQICEWDLCKVRVWAQRRADINNCEYVEDPKIED